MQLVFSNGFPPHLPIGREVPAPRQVSPPPIHRGKSLQRQSCSPEPYRDTLATLHASSPAFDHLSQRVHKPVLRRHQLYQRIHVLPIDSIYKCQYDALRGLAHVNSASTTHPWLSIEHPGLDSVAEYPPVQAPAHRPRQHNPLQIAPPRYQISHLLARCYSVSPVGVDEAYAIKWRFP